MAKAQAEGRELFHCNLSANGWRIPELIPTSTLLLEQNTRGKTIRRLQQKEFCSACSTRPSVEKTLIPKFSEQPLKEREVYMFLGQ